MEVNFYKSLIVFRTSKQQNMLTEKNNSSDRTLAISQILNAPSEFVWEVWTNPEHIKNWWGPNGFTNSIRKMDVIENGEWLFTMHGPDGKNYTNKIIYREIIPFKKIVFEHFNPSYLATVVFEPEEKDIVMNWAMIFETIEMFETIVKVFKADEGLKQNGEKLAAYLQTIR